MKAFRMFLIIGIFVLPNTLAMTQVVDPTPSQTENVRETSLLQDIWQFEILNMEGKPITVGKIITGLLIFILGIWFSRIVSRKIHDLLHQLGMNPSTAGATKTLLFYGLVVLACMVTLEMIQVPLTVFTLLGGAVAIGVGFGSQNLLNNFISGLILLAERPIRVGDLIQIGDLYGTVTAIGGRSTTVKTGSNVDIIIPNSSFLEQNVINWTLTNDSIRTLVTVGVAYGSPVTEVEQVLREAVESDPTVLHDPPPLIIFSDFADSALTFEIHFWIKMRSLMDQMKAQSRLRFRINQIFADKGIVISFPQRDVHLDTHQQPLEVRVLPEQPPDRKLDEKI